ncbi:MAG: HAD family hydrolase, partial [Rhodoglobus sp.]
MAGMIRVALFDLDDTLFAHQFAVASGVAAHRRAHGGALGAADETSELARWHDLEEVHYLRYLDGELGFIEQRRERARAFVEPFGIDLADDTTADAWFERYLVEYRRAWKLHDDALPCLDALDAAGIRIGIITNGDIDFQQAKLDGVGLAPRIEHVIASGSLGFTKPDPRIFEHACEVFGVSAHEAAYVGDRLRTDAIGAAAAGLLGVWLDRGPSATAEELAEAEAFRVPVIRSLAEVPALLG